MALWEVPTRVVSSMERSIGALGDLPDDVRGLRTTLTSIDDTLRAVLAALIPMREDIAVARGSLGPSATSQLEDVQQRLGRLESLIAHIDERIPDPDEPGPIVKAKDALLGQDDATDR